MLGVFMYIFEVKKEVLVGLSISVLYLTYYLVEVVKKPTLVCRKGEFRQFLEENVPLLSEHYWPTPWCVESRLQTVLGSVLRSHLLPPVNYRREILRLSDGGQVALDWLDASGDDENRPIVIVLPGLTGGSHADYVRCLALSIHDIGAHCVVFNNRGLGGLPLTSPRLYCAVSHSDLAEVIEAVKKRGSSLFAVGVSLGGLILGHYLAECGDKSQVQAALIVSSPLDVIKGTDCIERPLLNALLSYHMARNLRKTVSSHEPLREGPWDWTEVHNSRSVREFDAAFTTKHFGFGSVEAYYRAATLHDKLGKVRSPLLCLCAADDPFQPLDAIPMREAAESKHVALAVTARGGHIGFLEGWWPARESSDQYIARLARQYFKALLERPHLLHAPRPSSHDEPIETSSV